MLIMGQDRRSRLSACLAAAPVFRLRSDEALGLIEQELLTIVDRWSTVCDDAGLSVVDRNLMWRRQFLNPVVFEGAPARLADLVA